MSQLTKTYLAQAEKHLALGDASRARDLLEKARLLETSRGPLAATIAAALAEAYRRCGEHGKANEMAAFAKELESRLAPPSGPGGAEPQAASADGLPSGGPRAERIRQASSDQSTAGAKRRRLWLLWVAASVVVLLGVGTGIGLLVSWPSERESPLAAGGKYPGWLGESVGMLLIYAEIVSPSGKVTEERR